MIVSRLVRCDGGLCDATGKYALTFGMLVRLLYEVYMITDDATLREAVQCGPSCGSSPDEV